MIVKNAPQATTTVSTVLKLPHHVKNSRKNVIISESSTVPKSDARPILISKSNQKNGSIDSSSTVVSTKSNPAAKHTITTTQQSDNAKQPTKNAESPKSTTTESNQVISITQSAVLQQETTSESSSINVASIVSIK